jgi:hypothetical protein
MAKRQPVKPVGSDQPKEVKKGGRPTDFNEEIAGRICELIAGSEKGIHGLYKENSDWMPTPSTIMLWLTKHKAFSEHYAQAKEIQIEKFIEQIIEISDDSSGDETFNSQGERIENREFVNRSRLRVDSRKWIASKLIPKKYGDKLDKEQDKQAESYQPPQITVNISKEAIDKLNNK